MARSRSRREKPSKCRGPCIQAVHDEPMVRERGEEDGVAVCTGLADRRSSIHRRADARERERDERGSGKKGVGARRERRRTLARRCDGFTTVHGARGSRGHNIMEEYLIGRRAGARAATQLNWSRCATKRRRAYNNWSRARRRALLVMLEGSIDRGRAFLELGKRDDD